MKKLSLLITAMSLFTIAAQASPKVSHTSQQTKSSNGSKTVTNNTTVENGDSSVSRNVTYQYDPKTKSVDSSSSTEINHDSSHATVDRSTQRIKNANGSVTVSNDTDIAKNGSSKVNTTVTREIEPNTSTQPKNVTSTRSVNGSKSVTREFDSEEASQQKQQAQKKANQ